VYRTTEQVNATMYIWCLEPLNKLNIIDVDSVYRTTEQDSFDDSKLIYKIYIEWI